MSTLLKNLSEASRVLNTASDVLSKQIVEFESALNAVRLGVAAWVDISREASQDDPDGDYYVKLGYGKRKGKWALLIAEGYIDLDLDVEIAFLIDAPREVRLAAVAKIPDLIRALETKAKETEARIAASVSTLKVFTERLAQ